MPLEVKADQRGARKNAAFLSGSMLVTFALLRAYLHFSPNTDLNIGSYNVHHLFTGLLLIAVGGIPLAVFRNTARRLDLAMVIFGAGLAMALDEWVFLIATDGSNESYLLPVSFWGAVVLIGLACVYTFILVTRAKTKTSR